MITSDDNTNARNNIETHVVAPHLPQFIVGSVTVSFL